MSDRKFNFVFTFIVIAVGVIVSVSLGFLEARAQLNIKYTCTVEQIVDHQVVCMQYTRKVK